VSIHTVVLPHVSNQRWGNYRRFVLSAVFLSATLCCTAQITVTPSSNFAETDLAPNTLNGKFYGSNFWAGRPGQEPWTLTYNLCAPQALSGIGIALYDRNGKNSHVPGKISVQTSSDGESWSELIDLPSPGPWTSKCYRLVHGPFDAECNHVRLTMTSAPHDKQPAVWGVQFYLADGKILGGAEPFTEKNAIGLKPKRKKFMDPDLKTVQIVSSKDGSEQPSRVFLPPQGDKPMPLFVLLHTWSGGYTQDSFVPQALEECRKRGWAMIFPHFRGPNWTPEGCASTLASQDILDAVEYVRQQRNVDPNRIYINGQSGGGHMTLVMTTRAPELWAGASAWVPISDLATWHAECTKAGRGYAKHMEKACGGKPGDSPEVDEQYRKRSSLFFFAKTKGMAIDVNHGIHDGHTGSVPVSHSLRAFNALAEVNGMPEKKLTAEQIGVITAEERIPEELASERLDEPGRAHKILFRRCAGPARITVFEGGHNGDVRAAIHWLAEQKRKVPRPE